MTVFWGVVALLLLGVLLMLLPTLWSPRLTSLEPKAGDVNLAVYRDQIGEAQRDLDAGLLPPDQLHQARDDIQRRLLEEARIGGTAGPLRAARRSAVALGILLPLASVGTYLWLGDPQALQTTAAAPVVAPGAEGQHSVTPDQIEGMVARLAERLKSQPADAEGWMMLGRSYTALARYPDAVIAFRRAVALVPADPTLLADFADVLGMAQGKRLEGEPAQLVQRALDADPRHVKALALAGSVAFEARDYPAARAYWERLIAVIPGDSDMARSVRNSVLQARELESGVAVPVTMTTAAATGTSVTGRVRLAPALAALVAPGDTLFVFARAEQGPKMPLAILRGTVGTWPFPFVLDDSMAMGPGLKLSGFPKVLVSARISRSGNALPQAGDLIGQSGPVAPGASGLELVIDRVQP